MNSLDKIITAVGDVTAFYIAFRLCCTAVSFIRRLVFFWYLLFYLLLSEIKYTTQYAHNTPPSEDLTDPATVAAVFHQARPGTPQQGPSTIPGDAPEWTSDLILPWGDRLFSSDDDDDISIRPKMKKHKKAVRFMMEKFAKVKVKRTRSHRRMIAELRRETLETQLAEPKSLTDELETNIVESKSGTTGPQSVSDAPSCASGGNNLVDEADLENLDDGQNGTEVKPTLGLQSSEGFETGVQNDGQDDNQDDDGHEVTLFRLWAPDV